MRADCIYDIIKKFGCFSYDCILFDGPWGIGKTYAIDKALEEQENVCSISMFGLQNSQQIYHEVLCQFVLKNNKAGKIAGAATEVLDGISNIWKSVSSVKEVLQSIARETVEGNHERDHYSQRQIDVIKNEIIPKYDLNPKETGIITPYRNQVKALGREITDIDAATVHKFQGKEMECIIISTVDDEISDFTDDPYLINVAVSRAKKKLMLVVTGNKQSKERNITDLIDYIEYNNFEVVESKIYSVFDYLYKQYTEARKAYLQKHKKISAYDSENLMYSLIEDILSDSKYSSLDVVCHFPLNMLIKNPEFLSEEECRYAMNPATHLDFLIYNRISKKPVLAIEVDGYEYHKKHTVQASRDLLKNRIMESYEIPLLRFMTNCSGEKEKIIEMLDKRMEQ